MGDGWILDTLDIVERFRSIYLLYIPFLLIYQRLVLTITTSLRSVPVGSFPTAGFLSSQSRPSQDTSYFGD